MLILTGQVFQTAVHHFQRQIGVGWHFKQGGSIGLNRGVTQQFFV